MIREADIITLSERDRARVMAALGNAEAKPNAALLRAAERYNTASGE